jgi:hypothetical protein
MASLVVISSLFLSFTNTAAAPSHIRYFSLLCRAQADKYANLLKGPPVKKGLKVAHVPPPPVSMHSQGPWQAPAAAAAAAVSGTASSPSAAGSIGAAMKPRVTSAEKSKWMGPQDFAAVGIRLRSVVAKPGFSDAANASLHDGYYADEA